MDETDREAAIRDLKQEIARYRRVTENITDKETLERLNPYLRHLESTLEARLSEEHPCQPRAAPSAGGAAEAADGRPP
jgi:hypothetical protein